MSPEDALRLLEPMIPVLTSERISLADALERVLVHPFFAPFDMPAFPRSAMDGYAVRAADIAGATPRSPRILPIAGEVLAGQLSTAPLKPGTAYRITTGGALPEGADTVLRQEDVAVSASGELITERAVETGKDVVPAGVNARRGEGLLPAGWSLGANDVALMAAFGATDADVVRRPRVAYVETGDELVSPGEVLLPGHIFGSNNIMLSLRAQEHGAKVVARRRVVDESESMAATFAELLDGADLVVSTGGVSVGPKDLVPGALEAIGCQQLFRGLSIRPGHPMMAAHRDGKLWIGLAGNPTAALITHEFFVRPIIWRMAGLRFSQGFNPAFRSAVEGPPLERRPRTSLYLGQLRWLQGSESVHVDRDRRPTALPAPFEFNAIVRVEPIQADSVHSDPEPMDPARTDSARGASPQVAPAKVLSVAPASRAGAERVRVLVYPADRSVASARLSRFPWDVGGILLAGGQSRRMGHSKLFLPLDGVPLIVRAYRALAAICAEVRVIGAPATAIDLLAKWEGASIRKWCLPDDRPGEGPLGGFITGLRHTQEPMALCLAADLPFVDGRALRRLLDAAQWQMSLEAEPSPENGPPLATGRSSGTRKTSEVGPSLEAGHRSAPSLDGDGPLPRQGFVLSHGDEHQPLAALYPTALSLAEAEKLWGDGGRAMHQFVTRLGIREVPSERALTNINRPEEYRAARGVLDSAQASRFAHEAFASPSSPLPPSPPLLAFSGHSGSGKTTLISRLIPLLKERGLRVVVIKHGGRFELDKPGKDSWLFKEAGADGVLLFSAEELAYMVRPATPPAFSELVYNVERDADVILVEGFKAHPIPKVVVLRDDETWPGHPLASDGHVQAVYGGLATEEAPVPAFARTPKEADDAFLPWLLDWITRRLT